MKCTTCKDRKPKFKLWQTSKNKYENFCGFDCLKAYLYKKYKCSLASRAYSLAQEFIKPFESEPHGKA